MAEEIKMSEFQQATSVGNSDDIIILQDGINKKVKSPVLESKIINRTVEVLSADGGVSLNVVNLKGVVATYANLPTAGLQINDAYQVTADGLVYVWSGTAFQANGQGFRIQPNVNGVVEEGNVNAVSGGEVYNKISKLDNYKVTYYGNIDNYEILNNIRINADSTLTELEGNITLKINLKKVKQLSNTIFVKNITNGTFRVTSEKNGVKTTITSVQLNPQIQRYNITEGSDAVWLWIQRNEQAPISNINDILLSFSQDYFEKNDNDLTLAYNGKVNNNSIFHKNATFIKDYQLDNISNRILNDLIKNIEFKGFNPKDKISLYVINIATNQTFTFYRDLGNGDGSNKEIVATITKSFTDLSKIELIEWKYGDKEIRFFFDFSKTTAPTTFAGNTYKSCGFSESVFLNFKNGNSNQPIDKRGVIDVTLINSNPDYTPVDVNRLVKVYTVASDTLGGLTNGNTGLGYDLKRKLFVVCQFSYAGQWALLLYRREDLTERQDITPITPTPYKVINVASYLNSIQGCCYDSVTDSYLVIGNGLGASAGKRIIASFDFDGNCVSYRELKGIPFDGQNGMLAIKPDDNNIYFSLNNNTNLYLLNRDTLEIINTIVTDEFFEGMTVNYKNGDILLGGDAGVIKLYDKNMVLKSTHNFATFPNENSTQNIEGMVFLEDGTIAMNADCYLHGATMNGNAMFIFDFFKTLGKYKSLPFINNSNNSESVLIENTLATNGLYNSVIIDCENTCINNIINQLSSYNFTFKSSNIKPTTTEVIDKLNQKYYLAWGDTVPSNGFSGRYVQVIMNI